MATQGTTKTSVMKDGKNLGLAHTLQILDTVFDIIPIGWTLNTGDIVTINSKRCEVTDTCGDVYRLREI